MCTCMRDVIEVQKMMLYKLCIHRPVVLIFFELADVSLFNLEFDDDFSKRRA